jgi:dihydrofolate reductase
MSKVIADITMSLDGYVTGPSADAEHGLGDAEELHAWVTEQDPVDAEILERATAATGAVVMGRRLFDIVDGPGGWTQDMGYGAQQAGTPPFFVVTHSEPQDVRLERELGMRFTFVDGLTTAVPGRRDRWSRRDHGRRGRHRPSDRGGPRGRAAPAPRTDAARRRNTALSGGHAPAVPPT